MGDYVDIDPQGVANGLDAWDTHANELKQQFETQAAKIVASLESKWWGDDSSGQLFSGQFKPDQITNLFTPGGTGGQIVQQPVDLGTKVRSAVNNSLASDAAQAAEMDKVRQAIDGQSS